MNGILSSSSQITARSGQLLRRLGGGAAVALLGVAALGLGASQLPTASFAQDQSVTQYAPPVPGAPGSFADLVENVQGAVVSINVTNTGRSGGSSGLPNSIPGLPDDHPFNEFFKRFGGGENNGPSPRSSMAQGSGFVISADGFVVTNNHVIDGASEISVQFTGNRSYDAKLIGTDPRTDLALLKIQSDESFQFVEFSNETARVGDWVVAVGNPFGLGGTVTAGIVSAKQRDIGSGPYDYLQIDAAVNRGNSGGPTFDLTGRVIGVNTAIFSPSGGNVGIAFAVPAGLASQVISELRESGSVERGWLGVHIQTISDDIAASLGMDKPSGALVSKITDDGPASKSDIRIGDAIIEVNGTLIENSRDLARKVAELEPDDVAALTVIRGGDRRTVDVILGKFPSNARVASLPKQLEPEGEPREMAELGLTMRAAPGGADGVLITAVDGSSDASLKGLSKGDVILEIGGEEVSSPRDVEMGVRQAQDQGRRAVLLRVKSGSDERFVALPLKSS